MRRRVRENRERRAHGPKREAKPDGMSGVPQMITMSLTPQDVARLNQMAALDARQQKAVRDWMAYYACSFEEAYLVVARENRYPPQDTRFRI
ncbi:hypothetical protein [Deinococcus sp. QL22]|uniref:hypothetical protein n=1 Tax=Deinococcus sp. QL22 TaxID=2939437 RepID=UPI002017D347|nr:hypothetical protein [Deinococcus sp. QL22]UQN06782.1 hypothetical protein M1R55_02340 [Deinococcus sp. QL22]